MGMLLHTVGALILLGWLPCFIAVLIEMFRHGETREGIACIIFTPLCGAGLLIAFIYGWVFAARWGTKNLMLVWTALIVLRILLDVVSTITDVPLLPAMSGVPAPGR
jgi:hypothetical protein